MQSIMRTFCAPPPFRLWDLCGRRGGTSESDSFVKVLDASPSLLGLCYQSIPLKNFRPLLKKEIFTLVVSSSFSEESKKYVMTIFFSEEHVKKRWKSGAPFVRRRFAVARMMCMQRGITRKEKSDDTSSCHFFHTLLCSCRPNSLPNET